MSGSVEDRCSLDGTKFKNDSPSLPRIQTQVRLEEAAGSRLMPTPPVLEFLVRADGGQARSQRSHPTVAEVSVCAHHL